MPDLIRFTEEEIEEARGHYEAEARRQGNAQLQRMALDFLKYFALYGEAASGRKKRKKRGEGYSQGSQRATFNRVEGMIARYFILKRKRKL